MGDFVSAAREFFSYRHRGVLLIPAVLAGPIGFALGLLIAPDQAGTKRFAKVYGVFLQTVAGAQAPVSWRSYSLLAGFLRAKTIKARIQGYGLRPAPTRRGGAHLVLGSG